MENGSDVVSGACTGEQTGGGVLDMLQFIEGFGCGAIEYAVAVVDPGCDECVDESFSG